MGKENLEKLVKTISSVQPTIERQRNNAEQVRIDRENRIKSEYIKKITLNKERLNKFGVVNLFEEIKENRMNNNDFEIKYENEFTEISLIWGKICKGSNTANSTNDFYFHKELKVSVDGHNKLFLEAKTCSNNTHYQFDGPKIRIYSNSIEIVGQEMAKLGV